MLLDFSVGTSDNPIKKGESNDRRAYQIFFLPPHWYRSINEAALLATRRGSSVNPPIECREFVSRVHTAPLSLSLFLSFFLAFFLSFLIRRRFIDDVDGGGGGVVGDGCVKKESRVSSSLIGWTARGLRRSQSVALNEIHHFPESLRRL